MTPGTGPLDTSTPGTCPLDKMLASGLTGPCPSGDGPLDAGGGGEGDFGGDFGGGDFGGDFGGGEGDFGGGEGDFGDDFGGDFGCDVAASGEKGSTPAFDSWLLATSTLAFDSWLLATSSAKRRLMAEGKVGGDGAGAANATSLQRLR